MSSQPRLELRRRRDLGDLLAEGFRLYGRNFGRFIAAAAAVIVPAQLIVSGLGLEQLTAGYDPTPSAAVMLVPIGVAYLVTTPLLAAMTVHMLDAIGDGRKPSSRAAILAGLEAFTPLFLTVVVAAAGIALGLVLILPGIYLAVRWYFIAQVVVVDGLRGSAALARSWALVQGNWWRVLLIGLLTGLAIGIPAQLIQLPFDAWADAADSAALGLAGAMLGQVIAGPLVAIVSTLLYHDLRARHEGVPRPAAADPTDTPPDPPGLPPRG